MRDRKSIHHYYDLSTGFYRIEASVRRSVEASLQHNVRTIMDSEMAEVEQQIVGCLLNNEQASMGINMTGALLESMMRSVRGYHHVSLLSCYRFLSEVFEENKLIHLARLNELVSGYWLGEKEAWLVRKPVLLQRDEQGRLHNASGPCIQYRDGWRVYAWHGIGVPEKLILHPEQVTREEWMLERNAKVRRAIQERLGNERFIALMDEGLMRPCPKVVRGQQELTPGQAAYAREFARERIAAMLSTAPIDEQEAEVYLRAIYRVAGMKPPITIRWFDSPLSFVLACVPYYMRGGLPDCVWDVGAANRWASVEASVLEGQRTKVEFRVAIAMGPDMLVSVWNNVGVGRDGVDNGVRFPPSVASGPRDWDSLQARIGGSIWAIVRSNVGGMVYSGVDACARDSVDLRVWDRMSGCAQVGVRPFYHARLLAFYRFFHEMFEENELIHLALFNEMVSGYQLGTREAWVIRKPILLERDAQGRLHSASGPCIQYRDGWGVYAWHGVHVPEKLILYPEQVTREEWMQELNMEVRRAIQERLGPERFIELVGSRQIDAGRRGKLIEIDLGTYDPERVAHYVQVQDSSTERQYYLRVPPSITTVDEAIAWTFGLSARDYRPGQET